MIKLLFFLSMVPNENIILLFALQINKIQSINRTEPVYESQSRIKKRLCYLLILINLHVNLIENVSKRYYDFKYRCFLECVG